eukprot:s1862_g13.t4
MIARSEKRILTVGDGDLSFSLALSRALASDASVKVIATTWLTREELAGRYHSADGVREELLHRGAVVLHRVDACNLSSSLPPTIGCPMAIIFNFPHLGGVADDGHEPESAHVRQHTALLAHFFQSAANLTQGEVHVTLCGEQPGLWALQTAAAAVGMREQRRYAPAAGDDFAKGVFDGLCLQPPQPEWQCRRRWRNGSLGFVHWASRYGYEHRRHEGEQHMSINNCFTFVFVKTTEEAARSIPSSPTVCRICLQDFENKESLEQHMRTPALPIGEASTHHCSVCGRAFGSSRALEQHTRACQKPAKPLKESSGYSEVLREGLPGNVVRMEVPITSEAGLRLSHLARQSDKLRRLLPSKAAVKRAIARGELVLNGEHVEETRRLKAGDLVSLCLDRVREALDATTARARNVKMVLPRESPGASPGVSPGDGWQVLRSVCPDGVSTLEPAGNWLLRTIFGRQVPVTDEVQQLLIGGLAAGRVVHTFRAMLHGSIGKPGTTLTLTGQESGCHEEASDSEELDSAEQAPIAKADNIVCHVVDVQHETTSIVDLQVVGAGRCCGALCHLMRRQGFPVVGDRLAKRALSQRGRGLSEPGGAKTGKRKLQIECVGISASHEDGREFLDVRICRQGPASFKGDCSESDDAENLLHRTRGTCFFFQGTNAVQTSLCCSKMRFHVPWWSFIMSGALGPDMSAWQQKVFDDVARRASEQSRAAEPKLLSLFDSGDFRSRLNKCCPSLGNLPSEELMERLSKQLEVVEVCSGFPAMHDPAQIGDSAGMSISFGLTGSFFLNDWEAVLLHSANPHSVWHKIEATYVAFSVESTLQEVLVKKWFGGCSGIPLPEQRYSLNKCYGTADLNFVMRFTTTSGMVFLSIWTTIHQMGASYLESTAGTGVVPCSSRAPLVTQVHAADGQCHIHVRKNNTEAFLMQDRAETFQYELKPFRVPGAPATLIEAGERPVYSMVNLNMIDAGSPLYGDVSAVFSNKHILNSTLLSSVDSGFFQQYCINGKTFPRLSYNCSAETAFEGLGTFLHNRHLFVKNMEFWKSGGTVQSVFQRGQLPWGSSPVPGHSFLNYLEATHLGKLRYPEAIRFLIGTFPVLFGTELGVNLQTWAKNRGWVLVWALGLNDKALLRPTRDFDFGPLLQDVDFKVNGRMIDPIVLGHTTAAVGSPVQPDVVTDFEKLWAEVGALRGQRQLTNQTIASKWQEAMLHFPQLLLRPLLGGDCLKQLRNAECVGVSLDGRCVCYASSQEPATQIVAV